jgi:CNT family concentrative nucleoside transporter
VAFQGVVGLVLFTAFAWVIAEGGPRLELKPHLKLIAAGLGLQLVLAAALLKLPLLKDLFLVLNDAVAALQAATQQGTSFVFGYLGGGPLPFEESQPGASFVLAFRALPLVLVVSALSALLFHWRILPLVVRGFAWALEKTLGVGGAVGVSAAANVFVGMVEAPLLVRPYLKALSRSELFMVMTCGMATIAGTMMVLYATILSAIVPDAIGHILTASIISAPAAIMVARLMVPETGPPTRGGLADESPAGSAMEAVTQGTSAGVQLLINIVAMLVVLVALVHLVNLGLDLAPDVGDAPLTLQRLLGWIMAPVAWAMGVPWGEAATAGALLGTKTVLNEFIAYLDFAALPPEALGERARLIMTYALCGFANLGSLGIMLGGLAAMVPERRAEVVSLGLKSILSGTLATCLTGTVVGLL